MPLPNWLDHPSGHSPYCTCNPCVAVKSHIGRKVRVYRFEDENGQGPYMNADMYQKLQRHKEDHPTPSQEHLCMGEDWFCGFATKKQIAQWFNAEELRWVELYGFKLVRYSVPVRLLQRGQKQVIFVKKAAIPLGAVA